MRQVAVYRYQHLPNIDWADQLARHPVQELSLFNTEHFGWEPVKDAWFLECQGLILLHCARRFKRVPRTVLAEAVALELAALGPEVNAFEKRQVKQRVFERLISDVLPEKTVFPVVFDTQNNMLWVGSVSESMLEKILKTIHITFPGLMLVPLCTRERVLRRLRTAWEHSDWPGDLAPVGDALLLYHQSHHQKIRCSALEDLGVISDCLAQGYVLAGIRLVSERGWSCFWSPLGHFQSVRYPKAEDQDADPEFLDWLPYLELRAWCNYFGAWVHESS